MHLLKEYKADFYPKGIWGMCIFDMLIYSEPIKANETVCSNQLHPQDFSKVLKKYYYYLN